jgi:hypothetical protein
MEIIKFVLGDFWHFIGFQMLVAGLSVAVARIILALRGESIESVMERARQNAGAKPLVKADDEKPLLRAD